MTDEMHTDDQKLTGDLTWKETVAEFERDSPWLTPADKPQLKALYAIAALLDNGTTQTALISQFTLAHARLLARGAKGNAAPGEPDPNEEMDILDLWGRRA